MISFLLCDIVILRAIRPFSRNAQIIQYGTDNSVLILCINANRCKLIPVAAYSAALCAAAGEKRKGGK